MKRQAILKRSRGDRLRSLSRFAAALAISFFIILTFVTSQANAATLNVLDYGAKGDGVTDDRAAIQRCIDEAVAGGNQVYVPAGTYLIGSTLSVGSGCYLRGDGSTRTVLTMRPQSSVSWVLSIVRQSNVTIRDLGFRSADFADNVGAIWCAGNSGVTLDNIRLTNLFWGIKTGSYSTIGRNYEFSGIVAVNCLRPMYISDLDGGTFKDWNIDAVGYDQTNSNQTHGLYMERNSTNLRFTSCVFRRGSGYGLHLYAESSGNNGSHHIYFKDCTVDAREGRRSIYIDSEFSHVYFDGLYLPGQAQNDSSAALFRMANPTNIHITGLEAYGYRLIYGGSGSVAGVFHGTTHGCDPSVWDVSGLVLGSSTTTTTLQPTTTTLRPTTTTLRPTTTTLRPTTTTRPPTTTTQSPTTARPTTVTLPPTTTTTVLTPTATTLPPTTTTRVVPTTSTTLRPTTTTIMPRTTPPDSEAAARVIFSSPADGSVVQGVVRVDVAVASTGFLRKVGLLVDGRLVVTDYRRPFQFAWNTRFVLPGSRHVLTAVAYDLAGREVGRASESLIVASNWGARTAPSPVSLQSTPGVFSDVAWDAFYGDAIFNLAQSGVVAGFTDGSFRSDQTVTRAQIAKMVSGALGIVDDDPPVSTPFLDLGTPDGNMYPHKYVAALVSAGAVEGTNPGVFSPWDEVTRVQVISILVRAMKTLAPDSLEVPSGDWVGTIGAVNPRHDESIMLAEYNGLLAGLDGYGSSWDPWAPASRGEVAQLLHNLVLLD